MDEENDPQPSSSTNGYRVWGWLKHWLMTMAESPSAADLLSSLIQPATATVRRHPFYRIPTAPADAHSDTSVAAMRCAIVDNYRLRSALQQLTQMSFELRNIVSRLSGATGNCTTPALDCGSGGCSFPQKLSRQIINQN